MAALFPRIFLIGFNRCGTTSLHRFFADQGLVAVHWDQNRLAQSIFRRAAMGADPVGDYPETQVFCDMECVNDRRHPLVEGYRRFQDLFAWHPTSYFILNTRPVDAWLSSRQKVGEGAYLQHYARHYGTSDPAAVIRRWRLEWYRHHAEVLAFFDDKPHALLTYDITVDGPDKLVSFLKADFDLKAKPLPHLAKTARTD